MTNKCAYPWQQMIIDLTGEVVPCCFWSGYGNSGKPLGNTNVNTIDEIWNNEEYQSLRRANASGNLIGHPCHQCMAYTWSNGVYPKFSSPVEWRHESGFCYVVEIPDSFIKKAGDSLPKAKLFENEQELSIPECIHDDIRSIGMGRYSVWGRSLYFSSSDNSDPTENGRSYSLNLPFGSVNLGGLVVESMSGHNIVEAAKEYKDGAIVMSAKPTMISLISTSDCNIDCPSCSQNMVRLVRVQHRAETVPDILNNVNYLYQFIWHGGEPYLIKRFRDFIDNYSIDVNPNLTFGFTSNGTMLSDKELEKLERFPRINASISIDSFKAETFEKIRKGASFDKVMRNLKSAIDKYNAPTRIFSVGMIVCKSNFLELPFNLKYAIDNGIGLNLSPVLIYPVTEQIDIFSDFETQTAGWDTALIDAMKVVDEAISLKKIAMNRVNPRGMLEAIRRTYEEAKLFYASTIFITVGIDDPYKSLEKMRRPGIIVYSLDGSGNADKSLAYVELNAHTNIYKIKVPSTFGKSKLRLFVYHDLVEDSGVVAIGNIEKNNGFLSSFFPKEETLTVNIQLDRFFPPDRPRNIHYANYGETTVEGLHVKNPTDIFKAYIEITKVDQITSNRCV